MSVHKIMQLVRCYVSGKQMKEKEREKSSAGGKFGMTGILKKRGNACRLSITPCSTVTSGPGVPFLL